LNPSRVVLGMLAKDGSTLVMSRTIETSAPIAFRMQVREDDTPRAERPEIMKDSHTSQCVYILSILRQNLKGSNIEGDAKIKARTDMRS
jgi:hypothetical protein